MKRLLFSAALMCSISMTVLAGNEEIRAGGLTAPAIEGKGNWKHGLSGDIILDTSDNNFYGLDDTGAWRNISAVSIPASATDSGYVDITTQTFAGSKTFNNIAVGTKIARFEQTSALADKDDRGLVAPSMGQYALTVSGTGWTTTRAVGIYYQDQDGNHRLKFNITGAVSSASRASYAVTISGVVFRNVTFQAVAGLTDTSVVPYQFYTSANTGILTAVHSTGTTTIYCWSGDVELESRPSWAT